MFGMQSDDVMIVLIGLAIIAGITITSVVRHVADVRKARWEAFATNVQNGMTDDVFADGPGSVAIGQDNRGSVTTSSHFPHRIATVDDHAAGIRRSVDDRLGPFPTRPIKDNPQA